MTIETEIPLSPASQIELPQIAAQRYRDWSQSLSEGLGKAVVELTGEAAVDLKLLDKGTVVVATAQQWDALSRRWKQRKNVQVQILDRNGYMSHVKSGANAGFDGARTAPLFCGAKCVYALVVRHRCRC